MKELVYHRMLLPSLDAHADKVGFIDGAYRATYSQHGDRVMRLCRALRDELGVSRADRFAVMATNSHQYLELYHAAFLGAGVINPLNLRLAGKELEYIVNDSGTEVVFVDGFFADHFARAMDGGDGASPVRHTVLIGDGDGPHDIRYEDLLASVEPETPDEPEEDDPVVLMYTGGTTGLPKGVVLEHRAEVLNLYHIGMVIELDDESVFLHQTPMFHAASMGGIMGTPGAGGTSVFMPLFDPGPAMALIEQHQVTQTVMVPTMIGMMLSHPDFSPERLASLKQLTYGASPMPAAILDRLLELYPDLAITQGYGMTESSSLLTFLDAKDHWRGGPRLRSAGRPVPGVILSIRDGWYHTGDAGYLDEGGYLFLVDRVKDMIVTGGENVYSAEVESVISKHEAVEQVAVIGIPHDTWGEQVHAIVVTRAEIEVSETDIQEYCREHIAGYKVPKSVELRTEPLPLSGAMKVLKRELRKPYWEGHERAVN